MFSIYIQTCCSCQSSTTMLTLLQIEPRSILLPAQWDPIDSIIELGKRRWIKWKIVITPSISMFYRFMKFLLLLSINIISCAKSITGKENMEMVKSHINSRGKDKMYYQLISVNKRSFSFRYRRLPQSHVHQRRIMHRWHQWLLM